MKSDKLDSCDVVSEFKHLEIREITDDGKFARRILSPDMTVDSSEHSAIQELAGNSWTNEVKDKWATFQEKQKAKFNI